MAWWFLLPTGLQNPWELGSKGRGEWNHRQQKKKENKNNKIFWQIQIRPKSTSLGPQIWLKPRNFWGLLHPYQRLRPPPTHVSPILEKYISNKNLKLIKQNKTNNKNKKQTKQKTNNLYISFLLHLHFNNWIICFVLFLKIKFHHSALVH